MGRPKGGALAQGALGGWAQGALANCVGGTRGQGGPRSRLTLLQKFPETFFNTKKPNLKNFFERNFQKAFSLFKC